MSIKIDTIRRSIETARAVSATSPNLEPSLGRRSAIQVRRKQQRMFPDDEGRSNRQERERMRFNEFGSDGGPAAKALKPKFETFAGHIKTHAGVEVPEIELKILVAASVAFKGVGSVMFIFGSTIGAYLLILHQLITTPILFDFYNYEHGETESVQLFIKFTQHMALFGALLFFVGMKKSFTRRQLKKKTPKAKTS